MRKYSVVFFKAFSKKSYLADSYLGISPIHAQHSLEFRKIR